MPLLLWDDAKTFMMKQAQINSSDTEGVTFLELMANQGYSHILSRLGRQVTEKVKSANTVADQRGYQIPPDIAWVKSVSITVGTTKYPLNEVQSEKTWDERTQSTITGIPDTFFYRPRFGVGGGTIEFDPIPSGEYTVRLTGEAMDKALSKAKSTTGTVTVTQNSTSITGSGTAFTSDMAGRYFAVTSEAGDRLYYRIASASSSTSLALEQYYQESTQAALNYEVAEAFALPEDSQLLPCYFALWHWWATKNDAVRSRLWEKSWTDGIKLVKANHATKTRDNIVRYEEPESPFVSAMPSFFPAEVS